MNNRSGSLNFAQCHCFGSDSYLGRHKGRSEESETGKAEEPMKCLLVGDLLLWATDAQSRWALRVDLLRDVDTETYSQ